MINDIQLSDKMHWASSKLSGGMKRKLRWGLLINYCPYLRSCPACCITSEKRKFAYHLGCYPWWNIIYTACCVVIHPAHCRVWLNCFRSKFICKIIHACYFSYLNFVKKLARGHQSWSKCQHSNKPVLDQFKHACAKMACNTSFFLQPLEFSRWCVDVFTCFDSIALCQCYQTIIIYLSPLQLCYSSHWRITNSVLGWAHLWNGSICKTRDMGPPFEAQSWKDHYSDNSFHVSYMQIRAFLKTVMDI